jgi:hypothetical protein
MYRWAMVPLEILLIGYQCGPEWGGEQRAKVGRARQKVLRAEATML